LSEHELARVHESSSTRRDVSRPIDFDDLSRYHVHEFVVLIP
jgi:hypothetical protein